MWGSSYNFNGGVAKKKAKLRHLILLSRVTYWAPKEGDALKYWFSNFLTNSFIIQDFAKFKVPGEWSVFSGRVLSKQFPFSAFRVQGSGVSSGNSIVCFVNLWLRLFLNLDWGCCCCKKFLQILPCRVLALLQKHFLRKKLVQDFGYVAKASCINLSAEFLVLHPNCSFPLWSSANGDMF